MAERVLDFDEALAAVMGEAAGVARPGVERVSLAFSRGRVLAETIKADRDQPPFDRSTRDGYAVRAVDLRGGGRLHLVGQVRAGETWKGPGLGEGEAIEIMTGAEVPAGADAVMMVEHVSGWERTIGLHEGRVLREGDNIVPRGAEAREGEALMSPGVEMRAAEIALAAGCGAAEIAVYARPRVAIVATGDELVEVAESPRAGQIRNSNSYGIAALVEEAGGEAWRLAVARDVREELRARVEEGRRAELLLFSGGVSMGKYDLVEETLREFGAEFFFTGVRMQPGKPVVFGRLPERSDGAGAGSACYFLGLPGNPVSTQVTFHCFAAPLLRAMGGAEVEGPRFVQATLTEEVLGKPGMMRLLPARLTSSRLKPEVRLVGWQGSGDMAANARANCYAVLPGGVERFRGGDVVSVLLR